MSAGLTKQCMLVIAVLLIASQLYLFSHILPRIYDLPSILSFSNTNSADHDLCVPAVEEFLGGHPSPLTGAPNASHMLYFLHIPRTAGRTYHSCFLKTAYKPSRRCARSYDVLRLNESLAGCGVLGSHDDYSITEYLPKDTAVITQLRDPVDRILSAYEFAIEVAARGDPAKRVRRANPAKVSTLHVWPWSYLVPWLEADIRMRDQRRLEGQTSFSSKLKGLRDDVLRLLGFRVSFDPYDNDLAMPLAEFLEQPIVEDLLHNGATLQILGATNYSHWTSAAAVRSCYVGSAAASKALEEAALARLRSFLHVGVQEALDNSIESLAADLGIDLNGPAWRNTADVKAEAEAARARLVEIGGLLPGLEAQLQGQKAGTQDGSHNSTALQELESKIAGLRTEQEDLQKLVGEGTGGWDEAHGDSRHKLGRPLGQAFRECSAAARKMSGDRRAKSLARLFGYQPAFSRESRKRIPSRIIARIREKNALDMALHEEGRALLEQRLEHLRAAGLLHSLPPQLLPRTGESIGGHARTVHGQKRHRRPSRIRTADAKADL